MSHNQNLALGNFNRTIEGIKSGTEVAVGYSGIAINAGANRNEMREQIGEAIAKLMDLHRNLSPGDFRTSESLAMAERFHNGG